MRRGEVYWYEGPASPGEPKPKVRPVVVVSTDAASDNEAYPYVTVVPVTSRVDAVYAFEVFLDQALPKASKVQPQNIFTTPKRFLRQPAICTLEWHAVADITAKLARYLDIGIR